MLDNPRQNGFDVNALLRKPIFPVLVTLIDRDDEGKDVPREILVRYQFDDEIQDEIGAGIEDRKATQEARENAKALAEDKDKVPEIKPITRDLTVAEQLEKIVKSIKGVDENLDVTYWRGVPGRHKQAIIAAINADVNPRTAPSTA